MFCSLLQKGCDARYPFFWLTWHCCIKQYVSVNLQDHKLWTWQPIAQQLCVSRGSWCFKTLLILKTRQPKILVLGFEFRSQCGLLAHIYLSFTPSSVIERVYTSKCDLHTEVFLSRRVHCLRFYCIPLKLCKFKNISNYIAVACIHTIHMLCVSTHVSLNVWLFHNIWDMKYYGASVRYLFMSVYYGNRHIRVVRDITPDNHLIHLAMRSPQPDKRPKDFVLLACERPQMEYAGWVTTPFWGKLK